MEAKKATEGLIVTHNNVLRTKVQKQRTCSPSIFTLLIFNSCKFYSFLQSSSRRLSDCSYLSQRNRCVQYFQRFVVGAGCDHLNVFFSLLVLLLILRKSWHIDCCIMLYKLCTIFQSISFFLLFLFLPHGASFDSLYLFHGNMVFRMCGHVEKIAFWQYIMFFLQ